jgi:hypothetical protein
MPLCKRPGLEESAEHTHTHTHNTHTYTYIDKIYKNNTTTTTTTTTNNSSNNKSRARVSMTKTNEILPYTHENTCVPGHHYAGANVRKVIQTLQVGNVLEIERVA